MKSFVSLGVSILLMFFACYLGAAMLATSNLGFSGGTDGVNVVVFGGCTLLGIVISIVVGVLKQMPGDQKVNHQLLWAKLLTPNTYIALVVSPIVLFSFLVTIDHNQVTLATYFAALQNGFFWQRVIEKEGKKTARS